MLCTDDTSGTCCCSGCEITTGRKGNIGTGATLRCLYLFKTCCIVYHGSMKDGYDTIISDNDGMSQGQKQLLCIARVMLAMPPMLILDEATSSIDTKTEMKIQNAFAKMTKGKTSFIVAHRLSTIKNADTILVMDKGKIITIGNHEQLLAKNGFYANLYNSQFA